MSLFGLDGVDEGGGPLERAESATFVDSLVDHRSELTRARATQDAFRFVLIGFLWFNGGRGFQIGSRAIDDFIEFAFVGFAIVVVVRRCSTIEEIRIRIHG